MTSIEKVMVKHLEENLPKYSEREMEIITQEMSQRILELEEELERLSQPTYIDLGGVVVEAENDAMSLDTVLRLKHTGQVKFTDVKATTEVVEIRCSPKMWGGLS